MAQKPEIKSAISAEEFEAWKQHPVSKWVFAALAVEAEGERQHWMQVSWEAGSADQRLLDQSRGKVIGLGLVFEGSHAVFAEIHAALEEVKSQKAAA